jgi:hypothetical protein
MGAFHLPWGLVAVVPFIALAVLIAAIAKGGATGKITFPYQPTRILFSPAERSFLGVLDQAVSPEHRVFGKVRIADIAMVKPGLGNTARQGALNRIASKHFDFVICRASDLSVICAVELNDKSHGSQRAQARDNLVAGVCQAIKLPLLTVAAKPNYSAQDLKVQFLAAISPPVPRVGA